MIRSTIEKIRHRENRVYAFLHDFYKRVQQAEFDYPEFLKAFLATERTLRGEIWYWMKNKLYYEQLFRHACAQVGRGVRLDGDMPLIVGNGRIVIGDGARIGNRCTFVVAPNLFDMPELVIGAHTIINFCTEISVECRVQIGSRCQIAGETRIYDNNSHSIDFRNGRKMTLNDVAPVCICDDVWIGMRAMILKGVSIGKGAVVAAGAIVTKDVPAMTVVAGNPARVVKEIDDSEQAPPTV